MQQANSIKQQARLIKQQASTYCSGCEGSSLVKAHHINIGQGLDLLRKQHINVPVPQALNSSSNGGDQHCNNSQHLLDRPRQLICTIAQHGVSREEPTGSSSSSLQALLSYCLQCLF